MAEKETPDISEEEGDILRRSTTRSKEGKDGSVDPGQREVQGVLRMGREDHKETRCLGGRT